MNSLLHNPLTELPLPYFLVAFAAFEVIGLIAGGLWIWLCDGTRDDDLPDVAAEQFDPYEVAFLQGGAPQVTRLAVFDLIERGVVTLSSTGRRLWLFQRRPMLRRASPAPDVSGLTAIQRATWNWVATPRRPVDLLHRRVGLLKHITPLCESLMPPLANRRLLETPGRRSAQWLVGRTLIVAFVGVGLYKLITMAILGQGEFVALLLLMLAGVVSTRIICQSRRLSVLGFRYLEHLQLERGDWTHASLMADDPHRSRTDAARIVDTTQSPASRLLDMALFGQLHQDRWLNQMVIEPLANVRRTDDTSTEDHRADHVAGPPPLPAGVVKW